MHFDIICTGYNCERYVKHAVLSVMKQTYRDWTLHLISDGSTDDTGKNCLSWAIGNSKITAQAHMVNLGAACRRYECISELENPNSVCILFGMDDEMLPHCLETIKEKYDAGAWMTYGNWVNQHGVGLPDDFPLDFDEETHAKRDYRKVKYRSTGLNTFYKFLFDRIPKEDFKIGGKWIDTTTESEVMFSCLEMCGRYRIGVIKKPIVIYNQGIPNSSQKRLGQAYKNQIYSIVASRPKRPLYECA